MRIALIGYGKMGRMIEQVLLKRGHEVALVIDADNQNDFSAENMMDVDVAIEFTTPTTAFDNIKKCLEYGIPVVCGTTGWNERMPEAVAICKQNNGTFFYASNFSIGVNIFFTVNKYLAQIMERFEHYAVSLSETHHIHKKDAPSGTAVTLAEGIIENIGRKNKYVLEKPQNAADLVITAIREGEVPGIHEVKYESEDDIIEIRHEAKNRHGFALGAVLAAEYAFGKKGVLSMKDLLNL